MKTLCISQPMTPSQIYSTLGMTNTKFLFMSLPLLSISFILVYAFVTRLYLWLRYKLPPGPFPLPIIGNLYNIIPDRALCFEKWSRTYGPIISVWFGSTLNVVVSSPGLAKEVLKDKDESLSHRYRNHPTSMMTSNGKNLIWADYGPHFVKVKKICVLELFSPKSVEALRPIREDEVRAMIDSIYRDCINQDHHGRCLVLRKYVGPLAFNTITRFVLGKRFYNEQGEIDIHGLEFKAILSDELRLGSSLALIEHVWWLSWIYWFSNRSFSEHLARRNHLIGAIIEECKVSRSGNGVTKQSFVDVLLGLQERHGLSKDTMVGLLWDMITAGMDTTAIVVEWAMAQLVKNPMILHKAQHELDQVIGPDRTMTEADILNLPYLQCITKETLRLHPPTPLMLPHKASTHVKVGGYDIPKNTNVYVNVIAIGRDPTIWRDPIEFRPERFLEEDVDIKGHDFRALPFGSGRRMCPAAQLGINMVTSVIGNLLHRFKWSLPYGVYPMDIDMIGTPAIVNYMRTPLEIVPTPRLSTHLHNHSTMNV